MKMKIIGPRDRRVRPKVYNVDPPLVQLLPPANKVTGRNVFSHVCLSVSPWGRGPHVTVIHDAVSQSQVMCGPSRPTPPCTGTPHCTELPAMTPGHVQSDLTWTSPYMDPPCIFRLVQLGPDHHRDPPVHVQTFSQCSPDCWQAGS